MSHSDDLIRAAVEYLSLGLPVIALTGKTPNVKLHKTGLHSALRGEPETAEDIQFISGFFRHPDTTGVGILTGEPYLVVDIDGEDGADQWLALAGDAYDPEEARWVAKTGRGLHIWYNPGLLLRANGDTFVAATGTLKLGSKLDLKGYGGYVAAPPSKHPDGHMYEWLRAPSAEARPLEVPKPLARRIEDHLYDLQAAMESKAVRARAYGPKYKEGDTVFYAQASHEALFEGMLKAVEGNRNNYLHWAAKTLDDEGGTAEEFDLLEEYALKAGLDRVEVRRTLRSARD